MYTVTYDNGEGEVLLYDPLRPALIEAQLETEIGRAGSLTLKFPPDDDRRRALVEIKTLIFVYLDGACVWCGRVLDRTLDMYGVMSVTCEGAPAYLNDVILAPFRYRGTAEGLLQYVLGRYNAGADARRQLIYKAGAGQATVDVEQTDYCTALEALASIPETLYLTAERGEADGAVWTFLTLVGDPPAGGQEIAVGENLRELLLTRSGADLVTCLIPLGKMQTTTADQTSAAERTVSDGSQTSGELTPVTGSAVELQCYNFLRFEMGFNLAATCAVLANIEAESSFNPGVIGDNGTSLGLVQWHASRRRDCIRWCEAHGYDYRTAAGQLQYLRHDLIDNFYKVYNYLRTLKPYDNEAYAGAYYMCVNYEVPSDRYTKGKERGESARYRFFPHYNEIETEGTQESAQPINADDASYDDAEKEAE